jgi:hypothetical protein
MAHANPFVQFLADELDLNETALPDPNRVNDAGNTLGAICVRLGVLSIMDIESILEVQREQRQLRFGEIAVQQGLMTKFQLERILAVQAFYRSFELGTLLVLDGHVGLGRLTELWTEFTGGKLTEDIPLLTRG